MNKIYFIGLVVSFIAACAPLARNQRNDEGAVKTTVFKAFVSSRLGNSSLYKLFFLDVTSEAEEKKLSSFFRNSNPPVICGTNRLVLEDYGMVFDNITGSRVIVFSVSVNNFKFPKAKATATAYTSSTGSDSVDYDLLFTNKEWHIISTKQGPLSRNKLKWDISKKKTMLPWRTCAKIEQLPLIVYDHKPQSECPYSNGMYSCLVDFNRNF